MKNTTIRTAASAAFATSLTAVLLAAGVTPAVASVEPAPENTSAPVIREMDHLGLDNESVSKDLLESATEENTSATTETETPAPETPIDAPVDVTPAPEETAPDTDTLTDIASSRFALPLQNKGYWVSSYFGPRCPVAVGAGTFHNAVDLADDMGSPIYAMASGTVVGTDNYTLSIDHGTVDGKKLIIGFTHMYDPAKYVQVGSKVTKGQRVADIGSAGVSNGPHLHLSVKWGGTYIDPLPFLKKHGMDLVAHATRAVQKTSPTSCDVFTTSRTALKSSPSFTAKTATVLTKDEPLTLTPGPTLGDGFNKVTTKSGKTGYVLVYRTSTKHAPAEPTPTYGKTEKGVQYYTLGNRHLFSYPGKNMNITGVLDTVPVSQTVTTTGRTANGMTEMTWKGITGWMPIEAMKRIEPSKLSKPAQPSKPSTPPSKPSKPSTPEKSTAKSVPVHRFWSSKFANAHFYTANQSEATSVRSGDKNWKYEGSSFRAYLPKNGSCQQGQVPVYRFWSSKFSSHFYTTNVSEMKSLRASDPNWAFEGLTFCEAASASGNTPVYRFWSPKFQKHFYTANTAEMRSLRNNDPSWNYEGIAWYAPKK